MQYKDRHISGGMKYRESSLLSQNRFSLKVTFSFLQDILAFIPLGYNESTTTTTTSNNCNVLPFLLT